MTGEDRTMEQRALRVIFFVAPKQSYIRFKVIEEFYSYYDGRQIVSEGFCSPYGNIQYMSSWEVLPGLEQQGFISSRRTGPYNHCDYKFTTKVL